MNYEDKKSLDLAADLVKRDDIKRFELKKRLDDDAFFLKAYFAKMDAEFFYRNREIATAEGPQVTKTHLSVVGHEAAPEKVKRHVLNTSARDLLAAFLALLAAALTIMRNPVTFNKVRDFERRLRGGPTPGNGGGFDDGTSSGPGGRGGPRGGGGLPIPYDAYMATFYATKEEFDFSRDAFLTLRRAAIESKGVIKCIATDDFEGGRALVKAAPSIPDFERKLNDGAAQALLLELAPSPHSETSFLHNGVALAGVTLRLAEEAGISHVNAFIAITSASICLQNLHNFAQTRKSIAAQAEMASFIAAIPLVQAPGAKGTHGPTAVDNLRRGPNGRMLEPTPAGRR